MDCQHCGKPAHSVQEISDFLVVQSTIWRKFESYTENVIASDFALFTLKNQSKTLLNIAKITLGLAQEKHDTKCSKIRLNVTLFYT